MRTNKQKLHAYCISAVRQRRLQLEKIMNSNRLALDAETKSSAGDKHETGRAMLQLEMEKASRQFSDILKMETVLQRIDPEKRRERIALGNVVFTDATAYYIAVGLGEISVDGKSYFVISPQSPIGKLLLGKKTGDTFVFNGKDFRILKVI